MDSSEHTRKLTISLTYLGAIKSNVRMVVPIQRMGWQVQISCGCELVLSQQPEGGSGPSAH